MPITHLGLTVKVGYPAKSVRGHDCFINQFTAIKTLKSFSLNLASYQVSQKANKEIEEKLREKLIKGYVTKEKKKILKLKRSVAEDGANAMELKRRAKRPSMKSHQVPNPALKVKATSTAPAQSKQSMLSTYKLLHSYATSFDAEATPVKIRLARAHKAAKKGKERKFKELARSIVNTLEEQSSKVATTRSNLSTFAPASGLLGSGFGKFLSSRLPGFPQQSSAEDSQGTSTSSTFHNLSQECIEL